MYILILDCKEWFYKFFKICFLCFGSFNRIIKLITLMGFCDIKYILEFGLYRLVKDYYLGWFLLYLFIVLIIVL